MIPTDRKAALVLSSNWGQIENRPLSHLLCLIFIIFSSLAFSDRCARKLFRKSACEKWGCWGLGRWGALPERERPWLFCEIHAGKVRVGSGPGTSDVVSEDMKSVSVSYTVFTSTLRIMLRPYPPA